MKKFINTVLVAIILTALLSCNKDDSVNKVLAKSINLNKAEVSIVEGESLQLKAKFFLKKQHKRLLHGNLAILLLQK